MTVSVKRCWWAGVAAPVTVAITWLTACALLSGCGSDTRLGAASSQGGAPSGGSPAAGATSGGRGGAGAVPDAGPLTVSWSDPTAAPDCRASPLSYAQYTTNSELDALLLGRWRRCLDPQTAGEDVGVEFTADGRYWALTWNADQQVVRRVGIDYGGTWAYYPPGSPDPISQQPSTTGYLDLDGVITDPPAITNDPRQLRILFSPVLSIYVPLTAD